MDEFELVFYIRRENYEISNKNFMDILLFAIMGLFGDKKEMIIGNICPKCNMEFSEPERMMRHMIKAHKKKKFQCDTCR